MTDLSHSEGDSVHGGPACASGTGVRVRDVSSGSPAALGGLKSGDIITHMNDEPIEDFLDLFAASFEHDYEIGFTRKGKALTTTVRREAGDDLGVAIEPAGFKRCTNKCIFCFIDQLPQGLREDLYFKDEDYRLSFLHGNYLTLTNLTPQDEERILRMRLSPLYVSVHATDESVRERLLGNASPEPVLDTMRRLGAGGVTFHTQIVLVPGYNHGEILEQTVRDLLDLGDMTESIGVVPVGLTCHRDGLELLNPVDSVLAAHTVRFVRGINHRTRQRVGRGIVYAADELFMLSEDQIPPASYYDDYPQMENGIGMMRSFLDSAGKAEIPTSLRGKRLVFVTGTLAKSYMMEVAAKLKQVGLTVSVLAPSNSLFGDSVVVSALLSGKDIIGLKDNLPGSDALVLPPDIMNADDLTLDGLGISEMEAGLGLPLVRGTYDLEETLMGVECVLGNG